MACAVDDSSALPLAQSIVVIGAVCATGKRSNRPR